MTDGQQGTRHIGRPRAEIAPEIVLNAFELHNRSIRRTARALEISSGLCYHRLKEMGIVPLGTGKGGKRKNDL
jgi:DNA-binding NtrC family response regulator